MAMLNNQMVIIVYDNYDNYILYIITITIITSPSALAKLVNGVTILKIILILKMTRPHGTAPRWHLQPGGRGCGWPSRSALLPSVTTKTLCNRKNLWENGGFFPETIGKSVGKWDVTEESWGYNFFSAFADLWSLNWWRWASHSSKNYGLWYL